MHWAPMYRVGFVNFFHHKLLNMLRFKIISELYYLKFVQNYKQKSNTYVFSLTHSLFFFFSFFVKGSLIYVVMLILKKKKYIYMLLCVMSIIARNE